MHSQHLAVQEGPEDQRVQPLPAAPRLLRHRQRLNLTKDASKKTLRSSRPNAACGTNGPRIALHALWPCNVSHATMPIPAGPTAPAGPVGPSAPAAPAGPTTPCGPALPVGPRAPAAPAAPAGPARRQPRTAQSRHLRVRLVPVLPRSQQRLLGPRVPAALCVKDIHRFLKPAGPCTPAGPATPVGPGRPALPAGPATPAGPAGPAVPCGPCGPTRPVVRWSIRSTCRSNGSRRTTRTGRADRPLRTTRACM